MAGLLLSYVGPLTCRTVAGLRVIRTVLPVGMLRTGVSSHITPSTVALVRSVCHIPGSFETVSVISMIQCCRCFTSQGSEDKDFSVGNVSKSHSPKTEEKHTGSQQLPNGLGITEVEQDDSHRTQDVWLKDQSETCSQYDCSPNTSQDFDTDDVRMANPADSASASGDDCVSYAPTTVILADSQSAWDVHTDTTSVSMEEEDVQKLPPALPIKPSFTLVPYVAQSPLLQRLVALGVDLAAVEKVKDAANYLVQADWDRDIQPRLLFLRDVVVDDAQLGKVLTKNPLLLKEDVQDMQGGCGWWVRMKTARPSSVVFVSLGSRAWDLGMDCACSRASYIGDAGYLQTADRIRYLESKKFSEEQITRIVTSAPLTLLLPVTYVDKKLGFLQKSFHLTGDEVRLVASKLPKILPWKLQKLKDIRFYMKEMLGFSDRELKAMLLITPRVFLSDRHQLGKKFDMLHNIMGLSHRHLTAWPSVFRTRLHILEQRHRFLLLLGRAQYDPTKENYVSLKALVSGRDRDFCFHVAKASTSQFHSFLKSL